MSPKPRRSRRKTWLVGGGTAVAVIAIAVGVLVATGECSDGAVCEAAEPVEEAGSNLSYPAIWADGVALTVPGTFGSPVFDGESVAVDGESWWLQRDAGNQWQAESVDAPAKNIDGVDLTTVDWGDNLEAKDWPANQPVRVETVLFQDVLADPEFVAVDDDTPGLLGFTMRQTNTVKGPDEMWGTNKSTYQSNLATVYSSCARMTIQRLDISRTDPATSLLAWDKAAGRWTGPSGLVSAPTVNLPVWDGGEGQSAFGTEVNIQGKAIYGYNWIPSTDGHYRLTFSLDGTNCPSTLNTFVAPTTTIAVAEEEAPEPAAAAGVTASAILGLDGGGKRMGGGGGSGGGHDGGDDGGEPDMGGGIAKLDSPNNLTYIDVQIGSPTYTPYVAPVDPVDPVNPVDPVDPVDPAFPAATRRPMWLAFKASPLVTVDGNRYARFVGTARPVRNGAPVHLQALTTAEGASSYRTVASGRLSKLSAIKSKFRFQVRIRKSTTYRVLIPGNAKHTTSITRPVRVTVGTMRSMRIALRAVPTTAAAGGNVRFLGTATPARTGAVTRLEVRELVNGTYRYRTVARGRLVEMSSTSSKFSFEAPVQTTAYYRVVILGNDKYRTTMSRPVKVTIR